MSTVFCTECGVRNQFRSNFCFKCGNRLQKEVIKTTPAAPPKDLKTPNETQLVQNEAKAKELSAPGQVAANEPNPTAIKQAAAETFHLRADAPDFVPVITKPETSSKNKANGGNEAEEADKANEADDANESIGANKNTENTKKGETKPVVVTDSEDAVPPKSPSIDDKVSKSVTPKVDTREEGSPSRIPKARTLCRYYGSAKGCEHGDECIYSHSKPNSVAFCKYFNAEWGEGCPFENDCRFRHRVFGMESDEEAAEEDSDDYDYGYGHTHVHGEKEVLRISKLKHQLMKLATNAHTSTPGQVTKTEETKATPLAETPPTETPPTETPPTETPPTETPRTETDQRETKGEPKEEVKDEPKEKATKVEPEVAQKYKGWGWM